MRIKQLGVWLLLLVLLLGMAGCTKKEKPQSSASSDGASSDVYAPGYPVEVGGIELEQAPTRVITLSPGMTELACDLGFSDRIVGVSDYCVNIDEIDAESMPRLGTVNAPKIEDILSLAPEVVVSVAALPSSVRMQLEEAGIAVAVLPRAGNLEELRTLYEDVGRLFGGDEEGLGVGEDLFTEQTTRLESLRATVEAATVDKPLEICYLRVMPLTVATGDTFEGALLEAVGFANSGATYGEWTYPADKAVNLMPDVILYDQAIPAESLAATPIYNTTPAFQNAKCFAYDLEQFERQGVRMFELLEQLVSDVYGTQEQTQSSASSAS